MPLVSVIVPIYNAQAFLKKCLRSLSAQTLEDMEILCVDDGSTDYSWEELLVWYAVELRLHVLRNATNQGPGAARNLGIKSAEGEYIGFVDADDWVDPDYFESMYEKARAYHADIVFNDHVIREYFFHKKDYITPSSPRFTKEGCLISPLTAACYASGVMSSHLYRKDLILDHGCLCPTDYRVCEDKFFNFTASSFAKVIYAYNGPAYHYRKTNGSLTDTHTFRNASAVPFFRDLARFFGEKIYGPSFDLKLFNDDLYSEIQTDDALHTVQEYLRDMAPYLEKSGVYVSDYDRYAIEHILCSTSQRDLQNRIGQRPLIRYNTMQRIINQKNLRCSVILPVDGSAKEAERALKSVCGQTLQNLEILCLVQNKDVSFRNLLDMMTYEDNRIRPFFTEDNERGSGEVFALKNAKADHLLFLGVNEVMDPNGLKRILEAPEAAAKEGFLVKTGRSPRQRCFYSRTFCNRHA